MSKELERTVSLKETISCKMSKELERTVSLKLVSNFAGSVKMAQGGSFFMFIFRRT